MNPRPSKFSSLSPNWQQIIRACQRINFGRIENLIVFDGEPDADEAVQCVCEYRFSGDNSHRPELYYEDFSLPQEFLEFMENVRQVGCGKIDKITIKHGLPFHMEVRATA